MGKLKKIWRAFINGIKKAWFGCVNAVKKCFAFIAGKIKARTYNPGYISGKEAKAIEKSNKQTVKEFEKRKKRKNVEESEYLTQMHDEKNVVEFDNLSTYFYTDSGVVKSVDGVTFSIPENSVVGVVGESGCGKSVTALSLLQLVQGPQGQIVNGSIRFKTRQENPSGGFKAYEVSKMPLNEMNKIRGKEISMIFQEPMTSLNPVFTIGYQLDEVTLLHMPESDKKTARDKSIEMLKLVGIAMPDKVCRQYPHELSGGMRQRVMIAMALICNPSLIIADEPTTALDVTIQAQILELLRDIQKETKCSIMLITHDLGVIAEMADFVVVMYAGRIIEMGTVNEIFENPCHPYTVGLQKSKPTVNKLVNRLYSIPGQVPSPINMPAHCYFKGRCGRCIGKCNGEYPSLVKMSPTHFVSCYLYEQGRAE